MPGNPELTHFTKIIMGSDLFNEAHYIALSKLKGDRKSLIEHYVTTGENDGLTPSNLFNPKLYAAANPDVQAANVNLLYHYIAHGRAEGRFGTLEAVREAAKYIKQNNFFDEAYYESCGHDVLLPELDAAEEQLALWRLGRNPNSGFDPCFYISFYHDVAGFASPMHHYLEIGRKQFRIATVGELAENYEIVDAYLDRRFYLSQVPELSPDEDLTRHYLAVGTLAGIDPAQDFSSNYYLRAYRDIIDAGSLPYVHYLSHGREEGRIGLPDFSALVQNGGVDFDETKPTIVIANHEASRTGAPLVGLNLAKSLQYKYNIITFVGVIRGIQEYFIESSSLFVVGNFSAIDGEYLLKYLEKKYSIQAILLNSAETSVLAQSAVNANLPVVALVHEFAEYTKPSSRIAEIARLVDCTIVPAALVERSLQKDVLTHCCAQAPNIVVRPQGALPWVRPENSISASDMSPQDIIDHVRKISPGKKKFVLGAGHTHIRKGVDLFIQTAAYVEKLRDDVAFLWVGDGYFPETDLTYSLWVKEMVDRMGVKDSVFFFGPQTSLTSFYETCDIFYLPSRLDPFPNVVIDALQADKYVVCFEEATGCADMFARGEAAGAAVPHCDVVAAANAIAAALDQPREIGKNANLVREKFDFAAYADFVSEKLMQAAANQKARTASVRFLADSKVFDPVLFTAWKDGGLMLTAALRDYVTGSAKGLCRRNPLRGFSENLYNSRYGHTNGVPALESALRLNPANPEAIKTHKCFEIAKKKRSGRGLRQKLKTLLHIHAHYPDEILNFVRRLNAAGISLDIVATATSQLNFSHVEYLLSGFKMGKTKTLLVKNIGRDIGPFLIEIPHELEAGAYDIVGHLHTKKSLAWGGAAGATWRDYLLDTLIGDGSSALSDIMHLFANNEKLGLVFPDDGNNIGWSSNFDQAKAVAARFPDGLVIPERPLFPVGNMFWARPAALQPLWDIKLSNDDFPSEPLPYDGTILHAIERLSPSVCERAGYDWATVYVDGIIR